MHGLQIDATEIDGDTAWRSGCGDDRAVHLHSAHAHGVSTGQQSQRVAFGDGATHQGARHHCAEALD